MKDFIHKTLINAGGKDAVSNMLTGAAMGAGANTALGIVQGDFDVIGNATSGALLGAGGGAALRHAGDKYTNALAKMGKDAPSEFKFSTFSNAEKDTLDFWGSSDNLKRAQSFMPNTPAGAKAEAPTAGPVSSGEMKTSEQFRGREGYTVDNDGVSKITKNTKDMAMPSFTTFDTFGNPKTVGGGTTPMNLLRNVSDTEQRNILRADEIRTQQKTTHQTQAAKNPVQMQNNIDTSYKPTSVKDMLSDSIKQKQAKDQAARVQAAKQANDDAKRASRAENSSYSSTGSIEQAKKSAYEKYAAKQEQRAVEQDLIDGGYVKHSNGSWGFPENAPQPKTVASKKSKKKGKK